MPNRNERSTTNTPPTDSLPPCATGSEQATLGLTTHPPTSSHSPSPKAGMTAYCRTRDIDWAVHELKQAVGDAGIWEHGMTKWGNCYESTQGMIALLKKQGAFMGPRIPRNGSFSFDRNSLCERQMLSQKMSGYCGGTKRVTGPFCVAVYKLNTLQRAVLLIMRALNDGFLIQTGVLSGVGPRPGTEWNKDTCSWRGYRPEHWILLIGYEKNKFVFWDPSGGSSIVSIHGQGFGYLYYDPIANRLTTAESNADISVDASGNHCRGFSLFQHRYQVTNLQPR